MTLRLPSSDAMQVDADGGGEATYTLFNVVVTPAMRFELANVSFPKSAKRGSSKSPIHWLTEIGFFFEVGFF